MHATCKGTSCNIVACIPCGTMLQDVGWCWIKFQNVIIIIIIIIIIYNNNNNNTMLQDVGWCWIKFQNVQSFFATF